MGEPGLESFVDQFLRLVEQRIDHLGLGDHPHHLALDEEMTATSSRRYPDVGLAGLTRPVYDTSHHRHLDRKIRFFESSLRLGCHFDDVHFGTSTGWACDQVETLALPQSQELEELSPGLCLLYRIRGEREADGVADPFVQQGADTGDRFDQTRRWRSCLGHAEMKRIVDSVCE